MCACVILSMHTLVEAAHLLCCSRIEGDSIEIMLVNSASSEEGQSNDGKQEQIRETEQDWPWHFDERLLLKRRKKSR